MFEYCSYAGHDRIICLIDDHYEEEENCDKGEEDCSEEFYGLEDYCEE
ncbi:hypothetical protein [Paenibacillus agri]|uniref:Uncharacterized protein n=1 Tax=Paenibacillus agri TaxID=2744309 RepID=A0A850EHU6_9BACL|nr:hypothetical protein [Paenibacillus agri]NUU60458.1 hypothetical protein [Paenibacillus agri]